MGQRHSEAADAKTFWLRFYECFGIRAESATLYEKAVDKLGGARDLIDNHSTDDEIERANMNFILNALQGIGGSFRLFQEPRKYRIERYGPQRDAAMLRDDFKIIGSDLRVALKRDKQANKRSR